ncbi:hypothetical protein [Clostridium gasigenes]|uniref:Uncharacterized protein n=1 Tax=Clostridium gasigenes TaxID=94869 RepID=A0A7X0SJ14_9CLOT|nr:hypothetical protein [Clostridium gasigenes]MBB6716366.1 hypothetical protein [Clostridium gasigenes]
MDYKKEIYGLLKPITPKVDYFYPKDFKKLPCISYYIINDSTALQIGNTEMIINLAVQVDVWVDANSSTSELSEKVKAEFLKVGFIRGLNGDLVDPSGLNHKTMRFEAKVDLRNNLVYQ